MKGKLLFEEEQSFVNTWIFYLVIGLSVFAISGVGVSIWKDGFSSEKIAGLIIVFVVCLVIIIILGFSKLYLTIDSTTIYYRYPPFVNSEKRLTKDDVIELYVRQYKPIWEYGGWGYRVRPGKGRAMNVSGNKGLQFILKNNKQLLIGTQKPQELEWAIKRLKDNWGNNG